MKLARKETNCRQFAHKRKVDVLVGRAQQFFATNQLIDDITVVINQDHTSHTMNCEMGCVREQAGNLRTLDISYSLCYF